MARASRADVARLAGVSVTTVSHIMNGRGEELGFRAETAERVRSAAAQLGYFPRASARSFRYQSSSVIALFFGGLPEVLHLPVFNELLLAAIETAMSSNYYVLPVPLITRELKSGESAAHPSAETLAREADTIRATVSEVELVGAIFYGGAELAEHALQLQHADIPSTWVSTGELGSYDESLSCFATDERAGLAGLLAQIDLTRVERALHLAGPVVVSQRAKEFVNLFPGAQLYVCDSWQASGGYKAIYRLHAAGQFPQLLSCSNDYLASGALQACKELGIRVPEDIQIFGFGDQNAQSQPWRQLSSIYWPLPEIGKAATEYLISCAQQGQQCSSQTRPQQKIFPAEPRPRATTLKQREVPSCE